MLGDGRNMNVRRTSSLPSLAEVYALCVKHTCYRLKDQKEGAYMKRPYVFTVKSVRPCASSMANALMRSTTSVTKEADVHCEIVEQVVAEQATGIRTRVTRGGQFYDNNGDKISDTEARRLVREGEAVHLPNAGAGLYRTVANRLGFVKIDVEDWTSSAGDWCFRLHGGRLMWQTNRYPYHGFSYTIGRSE